jgi:hypothetical protein
MGGIIWLASYPKAGNTWLRAFLHNLLLNPTQPAAINELDRFCKGDSQNYAYAPFVKKPVAQLTDEEVMEIRPKLHQAIARSSKDAVFVKTHNALQAVLDTSLVTMECTAAAIYVVRNPLDVCLSLADHAGLDIDGAIAMMGDPAARTYTDDVNVFEFYGTWSHHVESWTGQPNPSLLTVRYEDMTDKPRATFKQVANFLNLSPSRQRLEKAIKFSSFKMLSRQEQKTGFRERSSHSEKFFRVGRTGQWRNILTTQQIDTVVSLQHQQMEAFGYLP